jgi:hypothetical protein
VPTVPVASEVVEIASGVDVLVAPLIVSERLAVAVCFVG